MKSAMRTLSSLIGRRPLQAAAWLVLIIGAALLVNAFGVRLLGGIELWQAWLRDHASHLLIWRLLLYAGVGTGWWRVRQRLLARDPGHASRLRRAEIGAAVSIALLEASQWLAHG